MKELPEENRYSKEHEWIKSVDQNYVIGITDFAQDELGEVVYIELPSPGSRFAKGDSMCVVESTKAASDVYSIVACEVLEVNEELKNNPSLINEDPYGKGWLVKVKVADATQLESLLTSKEYKVHISK
jgi:glycine cleavage system H protein